MRTYAATALIILGVLVTLVGVPAFYVRQELANQQALTDRITSALQQQPVRQLAAENAADGLISAGATDLLSVKPLLVPAIEAFLGSPVVESATRLAARDAYDVLIEGDDQSLVLDIGSASAQLASALRSVSPKLERAVPEDFNAPVLEVDQNEPALVAVRRLASVRSVGLWLPLLALALLSAGIAVAPRRRLALAWAGGGVAVAGGLLTVVLAIAKALTVRSATNEIAQPDMNVAGAIGSLWDSMLGDLRTWGIALVVVGGVIVIVGGAVISPSAIANWLREGWRRFTGRARTRRVAALRGLVVALLGAGMVLDPLSAVRALVTVADALALFWGLAELTASIEVEGRGVAKAPGLSRGRLALLVTGAAMVVSAAGLAAALVTSGHQSPAQAFAAPVAGCMGSKAMCDLRFSDVAIPATHNSFSAAEQPGWYFANQRYGIQHQLDDGIRGFLLDFHWGIRSSNGRVRTDLDREGTDRNKIAKALTPQQLQLAERLAGRIGAGDMRGKSDVYFCHTTCELGAELAVTELRKIKTFLDKNPGEIVEIFAEPYVDPADIARVFYAAGLKRYVATFKRDEPLPTLGEMVASNRRLVVFTEKDAGIAGAPPWYMDGFSFTQDTPLGATKPNQLRCTRERGESTSPLLMINHWIDTFPPRPSSNRAIGGAFLRKRLDQCARQRRMPPNMVPVDFYDQSGVVKIAAQRNAAAVKALSAASR